MFIFVVVVVLLLLLLLHLLCTTLSSFSLEFLSEKATSGAQVTPETIDFHNQFCKFSKKTDECKFPFTYLFYPLISITAAIRHTHAHTHTHTHTHTSLDQRFGISSK